MCIHRCIVYTLIYDVCCDLFWSIHQEWVKFSFHPLHRVEEICPWPFLTMILLCRLSGLESGREAYESYVIMSDFWHKKADTILEVTESDKMEQTQMGGMISWYWWNFSPVFFSHKIYPYRWFSADLRRKRSKSKNKCWEPSIGLLASTFLSFRSCLKMSPLSPRNPGT